MVATETQPDILALVEKLKEQLEALSRENKILRAENAILKQGLFGRGRERIDPGQLALYAQGDALAVEIEAQQDAPVAAKPKAERTGHGRAPFAPELPRETIELDLPEEERCCGSCSKALRRIGEEVTERGHVVPARIVVRRYVRPKYVCPDGHEIRTARLPDGVIDGGKYEASVYAHVVASKYSDHLPLHRLEGIFKRRGVHLPKQTMWDMLVRVDELVAQPVLAQMRRELLTEPVLHSDETPVTLCLEDQKGSRTGYAWGWRNLRGIGPPKVLIEFKQSRSRDGPLAFLGDWSGTLITDGYAGFDEVVRRNRIARGICWAHLRRKAKEALDTGSKGAARLLVPIQRLFALERAVARRAERDGSGFDGLVELRRKVRERHARRLVEAVHAQADLLRRERSTLPKSKLGRALTFLENQREGLALFLDDPRVPIHNNDSERDLRHVAVGRKNWLVFASPRGGDVACRLYSLVLSCKQSGIDPEAYVEDLLGLVSTTPASRIAELTPWAWAERRALAANA
ncbi:MAG TPA: IS66 family transposase [Myxococcota bacterium]|nr:IS66 family transposase [Myxococcota bacterium]